jgi:hypothetical protein
MSLHFFVYSFSFLCTFKIWKNRKLREYCTGTTLMCIHFWDILLSGGNAFLILCQNIGNSKKNLKDGAIVKLPCITCSVTISFSEVNNHQEYCIYGSRMINNLIDSIIEIMILLARRKCHFLDRTKEDYIRLGFIWYED